MKWLLTFLCLSIYSAAVHGLSSTGDRLLVIQEDDSERELFSTFWADLESRGYKLTFESPKNIKLSLFHLGSRAYDHLILLPPKSKGLGPALTPKTLLDFVNDDGNILIALSGGAPTSSGISSLLLELDIHLSPDRAPIVVDHFNYDTISAAEKHNVLLLPRPGSLRPDTKPFFNGEGILAFPNVAGQSLGNNSPLLAPIIRAPATAYSYDKRDDQSIDQKLPTGSQLSLATAMQARNSARITVLGSVDSLKDEWFSAKVKAPKGEKVETSNRQFAQQLTAWTFQETGVIKVTRVEHYLNEESNIESGPQEFNPSIYRIKNDVTFTIELSEYSYDQWIPFWAPENDEIQLEFTMLSPFHRLNLQPVDRTEHAAIYRTSFTLPDQHGIFSFRVNYKRPFLTYIEEKHEVTVRHFAHDEWPRSWRISGGWVWIAGLWSVIGGFLAFVMVWLYSAPPMKSSLTKKEQ
ncbi:oligosaccharyl transferase glycoprotein complex, beta subunit [Microsporum audouinii]